MRRILILAIVAAACARGEKAPATDSAVAAAALPPGHAAIPERTSGEVLTPAAQALLDSGNAAFRAKKPKEALEFYQRAAAAVPLHPAPWFGTYMAAQALGDSALADSAQKMIQARAPGMAGHPAPGDGSMKPLSPHGAAPLPKPSGKGTKF